ncbi:hypothetical protein B296_00000018 [Ensete ventricosum]|uniref:Uncharacterized protein n=1 Tax=Ensete ventricosum TaxID=4639 RepID=A0A427ALW9_ENSVE|nr:hypothetical protein B296_00000018 [Ensete ventricosum]
MKECGLETQYLSIQFPNSQKKPQSSSTDQSLQPNPPIIWKTLSFSPLRHQTATTEEQQQDDEFKLQIDRSEQFKDSRGEFCAARASSFLDEAFKQFPIASCEDPSRIGGGKDSVFPRKAAEEGEEKTARSINDERASMAASVRLPLKGPWLFQELRFRHNVTASSRCSSAITITRSIPVIRLLALSCSYKEIPSPGWWVPGEVLPMIKLALCRRVKSDVSFSDTGTSSFRIEVEKEPLP